MRLKILPYKPGSKSAKALSEALGGKRRLVRPPRRSHIVLNWGNSEVNFSLLRNKVINLPISVKTAANKLSSFRAFSSAQVPCPDFTTEINVARDWIDEGHRVVVRHTLSGHSGSGIEVLEDGDEVPYAPLYTKYIKKEREFRVHVFYGVVIDYTEKKARLERDENYNPYVRNHTNGWVFCRGGVEIPECVKDVAKRAVAALRLDFGAVDVIYKNDKAYALEVNTAPGLEGTTLDNYVITLEELRLV